MAAADGEDWRIALLPDSRSRIVNKITDILKRHLPVTCPDGILELFKIATRFEDKIFTQAQSQSDYLRRISLKMLTMESARDGSNASSGSSFNSPPYDEY